MAHIEWTTPDAVRIRLELAGAGSRAAAGALDLAFLALPLLAAVAALALLGRWDPSGASDFLLGLVLLAAFGSVVVYYLAFGLAAAGATPGKRALGLVVLSADGSAARPAQHALRSVVWLADVLPITLVPIGLLAITLTERRQRLGDLASDTVVVRRPRRVEAHEPWPKLAWSALPHTERLLPLAAAHAARFTAEDRDLIRALVVRKDVPRETRDALVRDAAKVFSQRLEMEWPADARGALRELYLFLREMRPV